MAVKAVILDVDGTLMDTNYLHTEAWWRAFEEVGQRAPRAAIHKEVGKGSDLLVPEFVEGEEAQGKVSDLHGEQYMARYDVASYPASVIVRPDGTFKVLYGRVPKEQFIEWANKAKSPSPGKGETQAAPATRPP